LTPRYLPRTLALPLVILWGLLTCLWSGPASSQSVEVPLRLQAELLSKVAVYDRGFVARAKGRVLTFIVVAPDDPESVRVGKQLQSELGVLPQLAGLGHVEEVIPLTTPKALADLCKARGPSILYFSVGLGSQIGAIVTELGDEPVLTTAVVASYVSQRAVLGFDAEAGHAKVVVHLTQARYQGIAFRPELLALARVIQ
jgi:hypothetical protein